MAGGATITTTTKDNGVFTLAEINALFAEIATVLNNKVDRTASNVFADENLDAGGQEIINVPDPVDDTDAVPLSHLEGLL